MQVTYDMINNPSIWGVSNISIKQTHISYVVLTGEFAYKIKKPMNFGFLDFSTLEKRKHYCEEEIRLNKRFSDIYLDVIELKYDSQVGLNFEKGEVVEYAVKMIQFDPDSVLSNNVNILNNKHISQIINVVSKVYDSSSDDSDVSKYGTLDSFKINTDENFAQTESMIGKTISKEQFDFIKQNVNYFYNNYDWLFKKRVQEGFIKECHGDLHLGNMFLDKDTVKIFDGIEFNERFKNSDITADLAFLAMDLDYCGRTDLSEFLVKSYYEKSNDLDFLRLLNFYKCYRAYVRGKVLGFALHDDNIPMEEKNKIIEDAKAFYELAYKYAQNINYRHIDLPNPSIVLITGFTGTGKSWLSCRLCGFFNLEYLNTDVIRREIFGPDPELVKYGEGIYSDENRKKVYDELKLKAAKFIEQSISVVIDISGLKKVNREYFEQLSNYYLINCNPPMHISKEWLSKRIHTLSDGRMEIYDGQVKRFEEFSDEEQKTLLWLDTSKELCEEEAFEWLIK